MEPLGASPTAPVVQLERPLPEEIEVEGNRFTAETPSQELKYTLGIGATDCYRVPDGLVHVSAETGMAS